MFLRKEYIPQEDGFYIERMFIDGDSEEEFIVDPLFVMTAQENPNIEFGVDLIMTLKGENKTIRYVHSLAKEEGDSLDLKFHKIWEILHT